MNVLETVFQQREFDGKIEKICRIKDYDNSYSYTTDTGYKVNYIPERWVTAGVYDMEMQIEQ